MLIDPFTVVAQVVNFVLLIWLLRRVLYGPITRAMEARDARIREEVENARRLRAEAAAEGERYRALLAGFEAERETRLAQARSEIEDQRQAWIREARAEVGELRDRWQQALEHEKETFLRELRVQVGRKSLAVMREALKELADADLEGRFVHRFLERLETLEGADRDRLAGALRQGEALRIRTAFALAEPHRTAITTGLAGLFGTDGVRPDFQTDPDLIAGIELRTDSLAVAWTLDEYLDALGAALRDAVHETLEPQRVQPATVESGAADGGR